MIFYIIYAVSTNKESIEDVKIRTRKETLQQEKIGKLFPKKNKLKCFNTTKEFINIVNNQIRRIQKTLVLAH